jgi:hypothetical protein
VMDAVLVAKEFAGNSAKTFVQGYRDNHTMF